MNKPAPNPGFFARLRQRLNQGRAWLPAALGQAPVDEALLEELESQLLAGDVGVEATKHIMDGLRAEKVADASVLRIVLLRKLLQILEPVARPLVISAATQPFVLLALGVNGVGKTTTLGKLAQRFKAEGRSVMLAAGDTFRAAAVEQLQLWGKRNDIPVIAQTSGADPAAVAHDAYQAAKARGVGVLLVDTAGRMHTQGNLMEELKKISRVLGKLEPTAPHERLLVLDAGTGQNALRQIQEFRAAVGVTGLAVTKLDGTAKGGIIIAAAERFHIPVRYIGIGEAGEDLAEFDARAFAKTLLGMTD